MNNRHRTVAAPPASPWSGHAGPLAGSGHDGLAMINPRDTEPRPVTRRAAGADWRTLPVRLVPCPDPG
jgi:hypothetical protein